MELQSKKQIAGKTLTFPQFMEFQELFEDYTPEQIIDRLQEAKKYLYDSNKSATSKGTNVRKMDIGMPLQTIDSLLTLFREVTEVPKAGLIFRDENTDRHYNANALMEFADVDGIREFAEDQLSEMMYAMRNYICPENAIVYRDTAELVDSLEAFFTRIVEIAEDFD
jgi:hypothetical protein